MRLRTKKNIQSRLIGDVVDRDWYTDSYLNQIENSEPAQHYLELGASAGLDPLPLFSTSWYLSQNPDVAASGLNPLVHYLLYGWKEERNPHPLFDAKYYKMRYLRKERKKINPLIHYLSIKKKQSNSPCPLFDATYYSKQLRTSSAPIECLLTHYIKIGAEEGLDPHPLFNSSYYLRQNQDIVADGLNPLIHYVMRGGIEGRSPHPLFDSTFYLERNKDVASEKVNPLVHYVVNGSAEGRSPHPLFDPVFYLKRNPDVASAGTNPLIHYVEYGSAEGRSPHPLFDAEFYLKQNYDVASAGINPLIHYIETGGIEGSTPHPLFDPKFYLQRNSDVASKNINPLVHFLTHGSEERRDPHPIFNTTYYIDRNQDVTLAGVNPLVHFASSGGVEGRSPHPLFDSTYYLANCPNVAKEGHNPLVHYLTVGAELGCNPNPFFDSKWYQNQHESELNGVNPLIHYITHGAAEERDPSGFFDRDFYLTRNQDVFEAGVDPLAHFLESGRAERRQPRAADRFIEYCNVTDIPFEILKRPFITKDQDVCIFVTYSADGTIYDHVFYYLDAFKRQGLMVVVVVVTDGLDRSLPAELESYDGLILRTNHGWDFAAWATALTTLPDLWHSRNIILANDSVYGPISDAAFADILERIRGSKSEIVSLIDSYQQSHHTMSFFTGITSTGLASTAVRDFWADVKSLKNKDQVIWDYEINSLHYWNKHNVNVEILFQSTKSASDATNPTLSSWRELLKRGFPFLKVQLLRDTLPTIDRSDWRQLLSDNIKIRKLIDDHLSALATSNEKPRCRPVPAPRRRFKRSASLITHYGATQSTRPTEATDLAVEIPFQYEIDSLKLPQVVAVVAHVFYPEMAAELLRYIKHIPVRADLTLTTDTTSKKLQIDEIFSTYQGGTVEVRIFPNVGRDIAPTFVGCRDVFERYEFFLHIHTKKSPHSGRFSEWRTFLLENLLGSSEIVSSILRLLATDDVGIVFSQHYPAVRNLLNWGYDFEIAQDLLDRVGVTLTRDLVLDFPSSSFFWGRSAALRPLLDLKLDWSDFPLEEGQIDGTIMHAVERSILYFSERTGYRWAKVAIDGSQDPTTTVPVWSDEDVARALLRTFRPLLDNELQPLAVGRLFPEVTPLSTRQSSSERPRLNLLIPTLNPKHIFGGITTALRLFAELGDACGRDFDRRIICVNSPVDLRSMGVVSDYTLQQFNDPYEGSGATVVDLSDHNGGELSIRPNDVFVGTAWWTASLGYSLQRRQGDYHANSRPLIYLIQDFEPGFYPWSDRYGRSLASYSSLSNTIALINSEELAEFMLRRYKFRDAYVVRYKLNSKIKKALASQPKERIILFYGRPSVDRNCFQTICGALYRWQQSMPVLSQRWRVVSAGEEYQASSAIGVQNLEVKGKLELSEYADLLSRAAVGISLMLSPHPSYPPLEMASAGLRTITNSYEAKNLSWRSENIVSIDVVTPEELASALSMAVQVAEQYIGEIRPVDEMKDLECDIPDYNSFQLAEMLRIAMKSSQ